MREWIEGYLGDDWRTNTHFFIYLVVMPVVAAYLWREKRVAAVGILFGMIGGVYAYLRSFHRSGDPRKWVAALPQHVVVVPDPLLAWVEVALVKPAPFPPPINEDEFYGERERWCAENVRGRWRRLGTEFRFSRLADAVHFKLRWC